MLNRVQSIKVVILAMIESINCVKEYQNNDQIFQTLCFHGLVIWSPSGFVIFERIKTNPV